MKLTPLILPLFRLISANPRMGDLKLYDQPGKNLLRILFDDVLRRDKVTTTSAPKTVSTTTMTPVSVSATTRFEFGELTDHTFTNCGSTGANGPSYEKCISEYSKNSEFDWTGNPAVFKIKQEGYQEWTVQRTGIYNVVASGARGGLFNSKYSRDGKMSYPGNGATVSADFKLNEGETIYIAVGQMGTNGSEGGGGGGGTFVVKKPQGSDFSEAEEEDILLVAAGGAGSPCDNNLGRGGDGQGKRHPLKRNGNGGSGREHFYRDGNEEAAGGGGFYHDGFKTRNCDGGQGFTSGLKGGKGHGARGTGSCQTGGGFGGGAGQVSDGSPGAGGWVGGKGNPGPGHRGGNKAWSYIGDSGSNKKDQSGSNEGNGLVVVKLVMKQSFKVLEDHSELGSELEGYKKRIKTQSSNKLPFFLKHKI